MVARQDLAGEPHDGSHMNGRRLNFSRPEAASLIKVCAADAAEQPRAAQGGWRGWLRAVQIPDFNRGVLSATLDIFGVSHGPFPRAEAMWPLRNGADFATVRRPSMAWYASNCHLRCPTVPKASKLKAECRSLP
jgi:hypothetical protein